MLSAPSDLSPRNARAADALTPTAILKARGAGTSALALLTQQLAPAAADLFASKTLLALARQQPVVQPLTGFVVAQAVYQLAGPVSLVLQRQWGQAAQRTFERNSLQAHEARPNLWIAHHHNATAVTHRVVNDVPWVVGMLVGLIKDSGALAMSLTAQMVVLGALVDRSLLVDLGICCLLGAAAGVAAAKLSAWRISVTKHPLGSPHARYGHLRERMWDNVLLGNADNFVTWNQNYTAAKRGYHHELITLGSLSVGMATLGQMAATTYFGLRLARLGEQMWQRGEHEALVAYLLPVAARSISLIGQTAEVGKLTTQVKHHTAILARLRGEIMAPGIEPEAIVRANLARDAQAIAITAADGTLVPVEHLLASPPTLGRFTVRGNNGGGKSMLGAALKQRLGARMLVLPAVHDLMLGPIDAGSSGETASRNLRALAEDVRRQSDITLVYLDEWDASLDAVRRQELSALIQDLAKHVCVLDITHRAETPSKDMQ